MTVIRRDSLSILKRHASLALLLGGVVLSACSNSGTPGAGQSGTSQPGGSDELKAKYPYLPGVNYSWTDAQLAPSASQPWVGPSIQAQGGLTDTYLSYGFR